MSRIADTSCTSTRGFKSLESTSISAPSIPRRTMSLIDLLKVTHGWPVEIRPKTHITGDQKCALDMVCVDGNVIEILAPTVGILGDQGRPCSLNLLVPCRWERVVQRELVFPAPFPCVKVFDCAQNRWSAAVTPYSDPMTYCQ